ncbi:MAG TPA: hypothetical protein VJ909_03615, partial [Prolixibacteraceae bacterium]|nr:hypothetical protein [Prolixibacteraceae bacterium]
MMPEKKQYIKGNHYLFATKVQELEEIAPEKFLLTFEKHFKLKAGQVVAIAANEHHDPRIYSICSGENDNALQVLFDLKTDGVL